MHAPSSTDICLFAVLRLDRRRGILFRRDERGVFAPLVMSSRALSILVVLVERPGDVLSRAEIAAAVWPGTAVEDSNLNVQIAALRQLLDARRTEGSCIQTIRGRGYRFATPVTRLMADVAAVEDSDALPLPDKPSLAVMPVQNMSGDPSRNISPMAWSRRSSPRFPESNALRGRPQFELRVQGPSG